MTKEEKEAATETKITRGKIALIHYGKQVPKRLKEVGFKEVSSMHLGKGRWMFRLELTV